MTGRHILVVDDDENLRWITQAQLEDAGFRVETAESGERALERINVDTPALVITDLKMPGLSGMALLDRIRKIDTDIPVVIITAFGTIQSAVEAVKSGAYDYLTKPIDYHELVLVINRAIEHQRLVDEVRSLRASLDRKYGFENIIGHSDALLSVLTSTARGRISRLLRSTAERSREICSNPNYSATSRARLLALSPTKKGGLSWRTEAHSFWMRSVRCRSTCRSSCCA
jgi:two-component system, NtrC family, response regulator AtoC